MGSGSKPSSIPTYPNRPGNGRPPFVHAPFLAKHNGRVLIASRTSQKKAPVPDLTQNRDYECSEFDHYTHWYQPSVRLRGDFELVNSVMTDKLASADVRHLCDATYLHRVVEHVLHRMAIAKRTPAFGTTDKPTQIDDTGIRYFSDAVENLRAHRDLREGAVMENHDSEEGTTTSVSARPTNRPSEDHRSTGPSAVGDAYWPPTTKDEAVDDVLEASNAIPRVEEAVFKDLLYGNLSRSEAKSIFAKYEEDLAAFTQTLQGSASFLKKVGYSRRGFR